MHGLGITCTEVDDPGPDSRLRRHRFGPRLRPVAGRRSGPGGRAPWNVAGTSETLMTKSVAGTQTTIQTTAASTGEVLAVNESITVPARTVRTVQYRRTTVA